MSTSSICGLGGSVSSAGGVTEVTEWTINETITVPEATSFASQGWKERVPCIKKVTGTFNSVGSRCIVGAHASASFNTGAHSYSGNIIVTKSTINTPVEGVVSFAHDFTFTGSYTVS